MVPPGAFLFLSVGAFSLFSFISIAVWTDARRKERDAFYKAETMRRVAESSGEGGKYLIEVMREEERIQIDRERRKEGKKREGLIIGGLVNIGIGVGMMIFLYSLHAPYLAGLFMVFIGLPLLLYGLFAVPKTPQL